MVWCITRTGFVILGPCGPVFKPSPQLFILQKATAPKRHQNWCLEVRMPSEDLAAVSTQPTNAEKQHYQSGIKASQHLKKVAPHPACVWLLIRREKVIHIQCWPSHLSDLWSHLMSADPLSPAKQSPHDV